MEVTTQQTSCLLLVVFLSDILTLCGLYRRAFSLPQYTRFGIYSADYHSSVAFSPGIVPHARLRPSVRGWRPGNILNLSGGSR